MKSLIIQAPVEDKEFFENLKAKGEDIEIFELERFEGLAEIVQVAIVLTPAVVPVLVNYFKEKTELAKARLMVKDGQKIRLNGYSAEEVKQILSEVSSHENDT